MEGRALVPVTPIMPALEAMVAQQLEFAVIQHHPLGVQLHQPADGGGVADGAAGHAVFPGLFNESFHHVIGSYHAHAVMSVVHQRGGGVFQDLDFRGGFQSPLDNAVDVDGLEAVDAVALDAALVGLEQHVGADDRVVAGDTDRYEGVGDEVVKRVPIYCDFGHFQVPFFIVGPLFLHYYNHIRGVCQDAERTGFGALKRGFSLYGADAVRKVDDLNPAVGSRVLQGLPCAAAFAPYISKHTVTLLDHPAVA